jgi:hypothetical protein
MLTIGLTVVLVLLLAAFRAMLGDMRAELAEVAEVRDVARPRSTHPGV